MNNTVTRTPIGWLHLWKDTYDKCDKVTQSLRDLLGDLDTDSPLYQSIWSAFDSLTKAVSHIVGDDGEFLEWFEIDCDMGKTPKYAKMSGYGDGYSLSEIATLDELLAVIEIYTKPK